MPIPIQVKHLAFTTRYNGIARELITDAKVKVNEIFPDLDHNPREIKAIWDTGATHSVVTSKIINELKLPPIGRVTTHSVHGIKEVNTYKIDIILPNKVLFERVIVSEGVLGDPNIDLLIGMDIITLGDFAVTNVRGRTILSFRIPSFNEIDYVPETDKFNLKMTPGLARQQRRKWLKDQEKKKKR